MNRFAVFLLVAVCAFVGVQSAVIGFGCPNGEVMVNCFVDPCMFQMQHGCHGHPDAECRANYCGGCNFDWYVNGQIVTCH